MTQYATVTALPTGRTTPKCHGAEDPDAWFPPEPKPEDTDGHRAFEEKARGLCKGCPVIDTCRERILSIEAQPGIDRHGIFAGLAPWEREEIATLEEAVA